MSWYWATLLPLLKTVPFGLAPTLILLLFWNLADQLIVLEWAGIVGLLANILEHCTFDLALTHCQNTLQFSKSVYI